MISEEQSILSRTQASYLNYADDARKALIIPSKSYLFENRDSLDHDLRLLLANNLKSIDAGINQNSVTCARIASMLNDSNANPGLFAKEGIQSSVSPTLLDLEKVRSVLRQLAREWSSDGALERATAFGHIVDGLVRLFPDLSERKNTRVLVPGCALGRLPYELSLLGFDTVGNEFSSHMALASLMILNSSLTKDELTIHPYIHSRSHWRSRQDPMRPVTIPDVDFEATQSGTMSMGLGDFFETASNKSEVETFQVMATCFFIDAPANFFDTLDAITRLVSPGGYWVNFGPLHWHGESSFHRHEEENVFVDLSLEDVKAALLARGWSFLDQKSGIPTTYCSTHPHRMGRMLFECEFWVAQRNS